MRYFFLGLSTAVTCRAAYSTESDRLFEENPQSSKCTFQFMEKIALSKESAFFDHENRASKDTSTQIKREPEELFYNNQKPGIFHRSRGCGISNHKSSECAYRNCFCHKCGVKGHLAPLCKQNNVGQNFLKDNALEGLDDSDDPCFIISDKPLQGPTNITQTSVQNMFHKKTENVQSSSIKAYQQILLDDQSKELVTISTHKGLFSYQRLPFGIHCAPSIFQIIMEQLFNIPGVISFLEDILVTGRNDLEHLERLEQVFQKLSECGFQLKKEKCSFMQESLTYMGHLIDRFGLHKTDERVEAVVKTKMKPV
ncbi:uncharacterized protein LOC132695751 [Cylas formicarius]|uniref:uncharacterized protein LOC132695751 n=1 Tax=Cylas formicarius TaxID=197179 RepID=UPI00295856E4|nr:uncharacterized protein LOC132695751 [Cylas formicarius]